MEEERKHCPGDRSFFQDGHVGKTTLSGRVDCPEIRVHDDCNTPAHTLWAGVRKEGTNGIATYRICASEVAREMVAPSRVAGRIHMTRDGSHTQARQLGSPLSFDELLQSVGHPKPLEANGDCANREAERKFLRLPQQYRHTSVFGLGGLTVSIAAALAALDRFLLEWTNWMPNKTKELKERLAERVLERGREVGELEGALASLRNLQETKTSSPRSTSPKDALQRVVFDAVEKRADVDALEAEAEDMNQKVRELLNRTNELWALEVRAAELECDLASRDAQLESRTAEKLRRAEALVRCLAWEERNAGLREALALEEARLAAGEEALAAARSNWEAEVLERRELEHALVKRYGALVLGKKHTQRG
ncbi:hypothetical protein HPB47_001485 [Ixodes persulcatus]|uniref:Uncharacterized protein n=1 Tax=Ixodes persulcatus TaxID=34615 RepID=A0AC60PNX3_IXOPE|nr:hypothetical protein HPB47_001485 [Ixodes persulcatus]